MKGKLGGAHKYKKEFSESMQEQLIKEVSDVLSKSFPDVSVSTHTDITTDNSLPLEELLKLIKKSEDSKKRALKKLLKTVDINHDNWYMVASDEYKYLFPKDDRIHFTKQGIFYHDTVCYVVDKNKIPSIEIHIKR